MNDARTLFGTDGVRARFGTPPLDRPTVRSLGYALARELPATGPVVVGGDTRSSRDALTGWVTEGLLVADRQVIDLGVVPTPAVAWMTRSVGGAAGIVISASHNPAHDNGIKLFDHDGRKWPIEREAALERLMKPAPENDGPVHGPRRSSIEAYVEAIQATVPEQAFAGRHIVLDLANGAATDVAPGLFETLGAGVTSLFDTPDGSNINAGCGSTAPGELGRAVAELGADFGFAFDGDADRALLVDDRGTLRDGDAMLFLWARSLAEAGELEPKSIVATSMSNLGLDRALARFGVDVLRCDVGDRAVTETMRSSGARLGGEQSGHLVDGRLTTTGDGLLTALQIAAALVADGRPVSRQLEAFRRFPQLLRNVPVSSKPPFDALPTLAETVETVEAALGDAGRLVLRYSGTESLARIMLEGPDRHELDRFADQIASVITREVGDA